MSTSVAGHQPVRAGLFVLAGVFLFACMDTVTKYLATRYAPPAVVAVRYIVHCALMIVVLAPTQGRQLVHTQRTWLVLVRAMCLAVGSLLFALALKRMPVAEASAVLFVAPILVAVAASAFLHEKVGRLGWAAAIAGFAGVVLIARPGGGLDTTGLVLSLFAACTTATYQLLSRVLASTERTIALLFYTALVGAIGYGIALPWFWGGARASPLELALFASLGLLGGIGHFLFTAAHRYAPASSLAPLQYVQLFWVTVLGWLAFGHVPDALAILGMGIIAASGGLVAVKSRLAARALERAVEA